MKKKYSYEYSYTVIDKKFSGKGIYNIASLKIINFLKEKKINLLIVRYDNDDVMNFLVNKFNQIISI
jgi:hypothetical protein